MLTLSEIQFPIYNVPPLHQIIDGEIVVGSMSGTKLIYSNNIGGSLAKNRLTYVASMGVFGKPLYKFNMTLFSVQDLFVQKKRAKVFLDSSGKLFNYKPTTRVPLKYYKLENYKQVPVGYILYVKDVHTRFLLNRIPQLTEKYVGLLEIGSGYLLYELSDTMKANTWRLI